MTKNFMLVLVSVVLVVFIGCGITNNCDLSGLKIKSIIIAGDKDEYVSRAIKQRLYERGAKLDPKGDEVIGVVATRNTIGWPLEVTVEVTNRSFASTAYAGASGSQSLAVNNISRQVELDFCRCASGQRELTRKE